MPADDPNRLTAPPVRLPPRRGSDSCLPSRSRPHFIHLPPPPTLLPTLANRDRLRSPAAARRRPAPGLVDEIGQDSDGDGDAHDHGVDGGSRAAAIRRWNEETAAAVAAAAAATASTASRAPDGPSSSSGATAIGTGTMATGGGAHLRRARLLHHQHSRSDDDLLSAPPAHRYAHDAGEASREQERMPIPVIVQADQQRAERHRLSTGDDDGQPSDPHVRIVVHDHLDLDHRHDDVPFERGRAADPAERSPSPDQQHRRHAHSPSSQSTATVSARRRRGWGAPRDREVAREPVFRRSGSCGCGGEGERDGERSRRDDDEQEKDKEEEEEEEEEGSTDGSNRSHTPRLEGMAAQVDDAKVNVVDAKVNVVDAARYHQSHVRWASDGADADVSRKRFAIVGVSGGGGVPADDHDLCPDPFPPLRQGAEHERLSPTSASAPAAPSLTAAATGTGPETSQFQRFQVPSAVATTATTTTRTKTTTTTTPTTTTTATATATATAAAAAPSSSLSASATPFALHGEMNRRKDFVAPSNSTHVAPSNSAHVAPPSSVHVATTTTPRGDGTSTPGSVSVLVGDQSYMDASSLTAGSPTPDFASHGTDPLDARAGGGGGGAPTATEVMAAMSLNTRHGVGMAISPGVSAATGHGLAIGVGDVDDHDHDGEERRDGTRGAVRSRLSSRRGSPPLAPIVAMATTTRGRGRPDDVFGGGAAASGHILPFPSVSVAPVEFTALSAVPMQHTHTTTTLADIGRAAAAQVGDAQAAVGMAALSGGLDPLASLGTAAAAAGALQSVVSAGLSMGLGVPGLASRSSVSHSSAAAASLTLQPNPHPQAHPSAVVHPNAHGPPSSSSPHTSPGPPAHSTLHDRERAVSASSSPSLGESHRVSFSSDSLGGGGGGWRRSGAGAGAGLGVTVTGVVAVKGRDVVDSRDHDDDGDEVDADDGDGDDNDVGLIRRKTTGEVRNEGERERRWRSRARGLKSPLGRSNTFSSGSASPALPSIPGTPTVPHDPSRNASGPGSLDGTGAGAAVGVGAGTGARARASFGSEHEGSVPALQPDESSTDGDESGAAVFTPGTSSLRPSFPAVRPALNRLDSSHAVVGEGEGDGDGVGDGEHYAVAGPKLPPNFDPCPALSGGLMGVGRGGHFGRGVRDKVADVLSPLLRDVPLELKRDGDGEGDGGGREGLTIGLAEFGCLNSRSMELMPALISHFAKRDERDRKAAAAAEADRDEDEHEARQQQQDYFGRSAWKARHKTTSSSRLTFQVTHEDSTQADFRPLIQTLNSHPESYLNPQWLSHHSPSLTNHVFPSMVARPFASRVLPPNSLHVGMSLMDLHWSHTTRDPTESLATVAHTELTAFLTARAQEFRKGGVLVLAFIARQDDPEIGYRPRSTAHQDFGGGGGRGAPSPAAGGLAAPSSFTSSMRRQRSGSSPAAHPPPPQRYGPDLWTTLNNTLAPCIQRLVSCNMLKSDVARHLLGLPLHPRTPRETRSVLRSVKHLWNLEWSCGLGSDLSNANANVNANAASPLPGTTSFPSDAQRAPDSVVPPSEEDTLRIPHPASLALAAGTLSRVAYAEHALQLIKNIYEHHFRAVLREHGRLSKGATEFVLDSLFDTVREKAEAGGLEELEMELCVLALRRA